MLQQQEHSGYLEIRRQGNGKGRGKTQNWQSDPEGRQQNSDKNAKHAEVPLRDRAELPHDKQKQQKQPNSIEEEQQGDRKGKNKQKNKQLDDAERQQRDRAEPLSDD